MANRRMFSLDVIDTDLFLELPITAQCLYFHLGMRADDDGFVASPRKITKILDCSDEDLNLLIENGYIIPFKSGVVVIAHWKKHNYIQSDRYRKTQYKEERYSLQLIENVYRMDTECIQNVSNLDTQDRIGKDRIGKDNINIVEQSSTKYPYEEIVDYLNLKTGKNFKASGKATQKHINGRFGEGFSVEDFKKVIDHKTVEWKNTEYEKYLRPETLFGSKFEGYLNSCPTACTVMHIQEEPVEHIDLWGEDE